MKFWAAPEIQNKPSETQKSFPRGSPAAGGRSELRLCIAVPDFLSEQELAVVQDAVPWLRSNRSASSSLELSGRHAGVSYVGSKFVTALPASPVVFSLQAEGHNRALNPHASSREQIAHVFSECPAAKLQSSDSIASLTHGVFRSQCQAE